VRRPRGDHFAGDRRAWWKSASDRIFVTLKQASSSAQADDAGRALSSCSMRARWSKAKSRHSPRPRQALPDVEALRPSVAGMTAHNDDLPFAKTATVNSISRWQGDRQRIAGARRGGLVESAAELWDACSSTFHTSDLAKQTIRDPRVDLCARRGARCLGARVAMHRHLSRVIKEFQRA